MNIYAWNPVMAICVQLIVLLVVGNVTMAVLDWRTDHE